ncbi:hypothetical protein WR25_15658 [Diploscapter pachys]|uniref:CG-1 domain-containing protein n=1 Tax=Diploscapter pachys TaxID=2018661 RepID=A0A2A2JCE9_9BILA|nr:hypothetical protein WR25_15658 [Diploscapter pachys]
MAVDQHQHIQPPDPCCSFSWQPINPKWNTNQEIYQILCNARMHPEIFTNTVIERPASGTQLLFARHDGNWFKNDGYEWRRRKGGRLIREDHMDLKVNKQAVISAHYAHSAVVPSFHRRIYSLRNDPQYVLIHYLNTRENEADYRFLIDMTVDSLLANSLYPNSTQLAAQLAPIYRYSLENNIIQQVSEEIVNTLHSLQSEQVQHQQQAGSSHSTSSSNRHLESRNSCSSAFRKGLSSLALRRQPSTFSDSIDVNFAGLTPNSCSCGNERQPIVGTSGNHRNSLDVANLHNASSSPSGATTKSSNLDEESLCLQQSISGSPVPASQTQFSSNQTPITDITPISGSSKGGTKVLVIGSFFMKGHEYSVQFGERRVPARLVQVGVLSLFSPPCMTSFGYNRELNPLSRDVEGLTALHLAMRMGHLECAKVIVKECRESLDVLDDRGRTPGDLVGCILGPLRRVTQVNWGQTRAEARQPSFTADSCIPHQLFPYLSPQKVGVDYKKPLTTSEWEETSAPHLFALRPTYHFVPFGNAPIGDEKMRRLSEKQNFISVHEKSSKEDHVSPTELWVMTNGETVTREHLLLKERVPLQKSPMGEEPVSSFSMLSDADGNEGQPGNDRGNWRDDTPLHVEISMDTNVFVPDSPKMADLFEAVTSPGIEITDVDRERMAQLAKQIIEAIPPRIKNQESMSLIEDDISNAFYHNHYNSPLLSQHGPNQVSEFDNFFDHEYSHHRYDHTDNSSSLSAQPSGSSFDHNRLHPNTTRDGSFSNESSRANTFESTSFDFDNSKDLGEFFNLRFDTVVDPLQQSLGNLKLTGLGLKFNLQHL